MRATVTTARAIAARPTVAASKRPLGMGRGQRSRRTQAARRCLAATRE